MLSTRTLAVGTGIVIVAAWLGASTPRAGAQSPERLGKVNFPTSCSPAVQAQFERAVALEHSFWFGEAIKGFNAGAQADPKIGVAASMLILLVSWILLMMMSLLGSHRPNKLARRAAR